MRRLEIRLRQGQVVYPPGSELAGHVSWELDRAPESLSLRLFWYTSGRAEPEISVVATQVFEGAGARGEGEFRFRLPSGPISFVGQLATLTWALELVAEPGNEETKPEMDRHEILVTETGRELNLPRLDPPPGTSLGA